MYTVTNRILVKKGFGQRMAPGFTSNKAMLDFEGFRKVEVQVSTTAEAHDEMNVVMYWDSLEQFEAWRASDDFKKAHQRDGSASHGESPILGSSIVISEIVATLEK